MTDLRRAEEAVKEWRCFHCDEVFQSRQEASDHFAVDGVPPMCVDPITKDEKARMVVVRRLEAEVMKLRKENEDLDHMAGCLKAMESELARYFGTCGGVPVKTASQAFLVYEAMIGRAEAAEQQLAALRASQEEKRCRCVRIEENGHYEHDCPRWNGVCVSHGKDNCGYCDFNPEARWNKPAPTPPVEEAKPCPHTLMAPPMK